MYNFAPDIWFEDLPDQIAIGIPIEISALASLDRNGHALTYNWSLTKAPQGSNIATAYTGPVQTVEFNVAGEYVFRVDVDDGYDPTWRTLTVNVTNYQQYGVEHLLSMLEASLGSDVIVTADGPDSPIVRLIDNKGDTLRTFTLPHIVNDIAVSVNGNWVAASHNDAVTIINLTENEVNTWPAITRDEIIIQDNGFVHMFRYEQNARNIGTLNPETGVATFSGLTTSRGEKFVIHPDGTKAYNVSTGSGRTRYFRRYSLENNSFRTTYSAPDFLRFDYCGNLWLAPTGTDILTACGIVLSSSDERANDMVFKGRLDVRGSIIDAAQDALSGHWYVIENTDGEVQVNIYDGQSGRWIERWDVPDFFEGEEAIPTRIVISPNSDFVQIYVQLYPDMPTGLGVFVRARADYVGVNYPPVTVTPRFASGFVGQQIEIDASHSFDPEGRDLNYTWSEKSKPTGSQVTVIQDVGARFIFSANREGEYVFSLVTSDGKRQAVAKNITVQVFSPADNLQMRLVGEPSDFVYNKVANQLIYTPSTSNELRIINLDDQTEWQVQLPRIGQAVDISPDGRYVAVSHTGLASLIEIESEGASLIDTQIMNVDWGDIVVDNNRVGYTVPRRDQWVKFLAIDFDNDIVHVGPTARARTQLRIMPDGSAVYGANRGLSPSDIERFTVSNLERISWRDSPYHGHYYMAGNLWIDEAGDTILVAGGSVFSTSENRNDDMVYEETLAPLGYPSWADHSEEEGRWVVIQNDGIRFYSDTTYNQVSTQMVDSIFFDSPVNDPSLDSVYYSQDGQSLIVIAHSEAVDENNYIVQVLE